MRVIIKGGVWKNTEDEILKAAVMKYGKNQWARISSLLVRKTPKQCKARWYEWLDPSIKKTEWSKEEDEKLLHLAKLMPTQWRTIAPIVGRTPAQCLERYQRLLDDAEAKEAGVDDVGPSGDDVRRLRTGEIDPDPETKPARPDPVDMDEDEKEMLSEARARLANTQGKKAKRKAREKQLEEARRLASLQKRRELKAAGIEMKVRSKKRGMDYNAEIPFHTKAPAGFWDISDEVDREKAVSKDKSNMLLSKLEGKRRAEQEEHDRKQDAKKQKRLKETGEYVPPQAIRAAKELQQNSQRRPLSLPAPQVGEGELEEIIKIGYAGESAKAIVDTDDSVASKTLLNDYSSIRAGTPVRTPRMTAAVDPLKMQARNLRAMTESQTPLLGGELALEGSLSFDSMTPKRTTVQTPNPLAAHLTPRAGVSMTPRVEMTPGGAAAVAKTPLRDQMGINTPLGSEHGFGDSYGGKARQNLIRKQLTEQFASLPKPKNDFEIVVPGKPSKEATAVSTSQSKIDEDAFDIAQREKTRQDDERERALRGRSKPVQRDLPRPNVDPSQLLPSLHKSDADLLVCEEMKRMIMYDSVNFPSVGQVGTNFAAPALEVFTEGELSLAAQLIAEEFSKIKLQVDELIGRNNERFESEHERILDDYILVRPAQEGSNPTYQKIDSLASEGLVAAYQHDFKNVRQLMQHEAERAQKIEKKLGVVLGGYQARSLKLRKTLGETWNTLEGVQIEHESFLKLKTHEDIGGPLRVEQLRDETEGLAKREREMQEQYRNLLQERDEIMALMKDKERRDVEEESRKEKERIDNLKADDTIWAGYEQE
ncbi:pre-mRNA splicing factor component-domain-containing protein [Polychytrium aggregatum]|uniref:pre-mRNA splicing factor component-domain-containing protein n=1 Tax=Polychytrium aggregatum TaxID=110093 RepID=UPI0022FE47C7|nr:pre-mRNA splicing factor component-domain-containing protein [Polychytrium aggregatum]KAI9206375.1 pre-mRNA splicing factor component-domain-containing protein [Polychytrium aggregatum]